MTDDNETIFGLNRNKVFKGVLRYFSAKSLFGNVFSSIANITGGTAQLFGSATRNGFFTHADIIKSMGQVTMAKSSEASRAAYDLIGYFDVDVNTYDTDKLQKYSSGFLDRHLSNDKLFFMQQIGDKGIQWTTTLAYLRNMKVQKNVDGTIRIIKKKADEEGLRLVEKDGKMGVEGIDLNNEQHALEYFRTKEKIRTIIAEVIGTASEHDQFLFGNDMKSAVALQFRRWILPMYNARFGKLKYNTNLEMYREGKYISVLNSFVDAYHERANWTIKELFQLKDNKMLEIILTKRYNDALDLNPELTYEEFKAMYARNLRSTITDGILFAGIVAAKYGLGDDGDDEQNDVNRVIARGLARTSSELSFWFSPDSFLDILKTPVPIIGLFVELTRLLSNLGGGLGYMLVDEEVADKKLDKAGASFAKLTIGFNAWNSFKNEIEKND